MSLENEPRVGEGELGRVEATPQLPVSEGKYPHDYRYYPGYAKLIVRLIVPTEVANRLYWGLKEYSGEEIQYAKEKKSEIETFIDHIFEDPEKRGPLVIGLERSMDLLPPNSYIPLLLRYGLDDPQNSGRTYAEVGKLLPRLNMGTGSVSYERARQRVTKAERQLRHPSRAKYYKDLLPSFTSQS